MWTAPIRKNVGAAVTGEIRIGSCTALAVMRLLDATGIDMEGKEAVIVGHSDLVGKPLSLMLVDRLATVTICHIATAQRGLLAEHVRRAEVLIVAVGSPGLIKGDWVPPWGSRDRRWYQSGGLTPRWRCGI